MCERSICELPGQVGRALVAGFYRKNHSNKMGVLS